jgi:hypothetical protein
MFEKRSATAPTDTICGQASSPKSAWIPTHHRLPKDLGAGRVRHPKGASQDDLVPILVASAFRLVFGRSHQETPGRDQNHPLRNAREIQVKCFHVLFSFLPLETAELLCFFSQTHSGGDEKSLEECCGRPSSERKINFRLE